MEKKLVKDEDFPVKPGKVLPHTVGAILLDESVLRVSDHRRDSIVLAVCENRYQPFVTWQRIVANDGTKGLEDYCIIGHYHTTLGVAMEEFARRYDEKMDMIEQSGRLKAEAS